LKIWGLPYILYVKKTILKNNLLENTFINVFEMHYYTFAISHVPCPLSAQYDHGYILYIVLGRKMVVCYCPKIWEPHSILQGKRRSMKNLNRQCKINKMYEIQLNKKEIKVIACSKIVKLISSNSSFNIDILDNRQMK